MSTRSLSELSEGMRDIDIAMLSTFAEDGSIAARPMSNNRDVDYDGDSYYFTWEKSRMVSDIERDSRVLLAFQGDEGLHVAVQGKAQLSRDKADFEEHWNDELDQWFEDGPDTKGVVMIKVRATRIHFWEGEEDGEVKV